MTYTINTTNGNELTKLPDGTIDSNTTSISLIGKNVTSFGELLNENFVKLLENFANTTQPENAIKGQIWYDTLTGRIKVFDGTVFREVAGPLISTSQPTNVVAGDIWINSQTNQLYFYDGTDWTLSGPIYTAQQGLTGFYVETVKDTEEKDQTICLLYVANTLLGIFSMQAFTPKSAITGYPQGKTVEVGFNVSSLANLKFDTIATQAENLLRADGSVASASEVAFLNQENNFTEPVIFSNSQGFSLSSTYIKPFGNNLQIEQINSDTDISLRIRVGNTDAQDAITIKGNSGRVGILNINPQATLDVGGDVIIEGDLTVNGNTTTITTVNVSVQDKNIILGYTNTPTDETANGGGITLKGSTDKTFNWINGVSRTAWVSSDNIELAANKSFVINDNVVLNQTTLGSTVTSSSLTSVGTLTSLQVDSININGNQISSNNGIVLAPATFIDVSNKHISNLASPAANNDATNKSYVDNKIGIRNIAMALDITGLTTNSQISAILDKMVPFYDPTTAPTGVVANGSRLTLHTSVTRVSLTDIAYTPLENSNFTRTTVRDAAGTGTTSVVADLSAEQIISPPVATVTVVRQDKLFVMTAGEWVFDSDLGEAYSVPGNGLGYYLP